MAMNALEFYNNVQEYIHSNQFLSKNEEEKKQRLETYNAHLQKLQKQESADMDDEEFEAYKAQFKPYEANKQFTPQGRSSEFAKRIQEAKKSEAWENLPDNEKAKYNQVIGQKYRELRLAEGLPIEPVEYDAKADAAQNTVKEWTGIEPQNQPQQVKDLSWKTGAKSVGKSLGRVPGSLVSTGMGAAGFGYDLLGSGLQVLPWQWTKNLGQLSKDTGAVLGTAANALDIANRNILPPEQKQSSSIGEWWNDRNAEQKVLGILDEAPEQFFTFVLPMLTGHAAAKSAQLAQEGKLGGWLGNLLNKISANPKYAKWFKDSAKGLEKGLASANKLLSGIDPQKAYKKGAYLGSSLLEASEMAKDAYRNHGEIRSPLNMLGHALVAGKLESLVPEKLGGVFSPQTRAMLRRDFGKGAWKSSAHFLKNLGKDTLYNMVEEGLTELAQTYVEQSADMYNSKGLTADGIAPIHDINSAFETLKKDGINGLLKEAGRNERIADIFMATILGGITGGVGTAMAHPVNYVRYNTSPEGYLDRYRENRENLLNDINNSSLSEDERNQKRQELDRLEDAKNKWELSNPLNSGDGQYTTVMRSLHEMADPETSEDDLKDAIRTLSELNDNELLYYIGRLINAGWKTNDTFNKNLEKLFKYDTVLQNWGERDAISKFLRGEQLTSEEERIVQSALNKYSGQTSDIGGALNQEIDYLNQQPNTLWNPLFSDSNDIQQRTQQIQSGINRFYQPDTQQISQQNTQQNTQQTSQQSQQQTPQEPPLVNVNSNNEQNATPQQQQNIQQTQQDPRIQQIQNRIRQLEQQKAKDEQEKEQLRQQIVQQQKTGANANIQGQPLPDGRHGFIGNKARLKAGDIDTECNYAIVELSDLQTLTDEENPRQRNDRKAYANTVSERARNLDPDLLIDNSVGAQNGPIVVDQNLKVESGNGRTLSLREAYANRKGEGEYSNTETDAGYGKADIYRNKLIAEAPKYGISSEQVMQMKEPVLVRIRVADSNINAKDFWAKANNSQQESMSSTETALVDGEKVKPFLNQFEAIGDIRAKSNLKFVKSFLEKICSPYELNSMFTADGRSLSEAGEKRINNAIIASAYGNSEIVSLLTELGNEEIQTILNGLAMAAPDTAKLMGEVKSGAVHNVDFSKDLADAIRTIKNIRQNPDMNRLIKQFGSVSEVYLRQGLLGDDGLSPTARLFIGALGNLNNKETICNFLKSVNNTVRAEGNPNQLGMFEANTKPSDEVFVERAIRNMGLEYRNGKPIADDIERLKQGPVHVASNDDFHAEDAQGRRYSLGQTENTNTRTPEENYQLLMNQEPIDISINPLSNLVGKEQRTEAKNIYKRLLKIRVKTTDGKTVNFTNTGYKELKNHSANPLTLQIIPNLDELVRNAIYLYSEANHEQKRYNVDQYHYYTVKAQLINPETSKKEDYAVRIVLREDTNGNIFYDGDSTEITKIGKLREQSHRVPNTGNHVAPTNSLLDYFKNVKPLENDNSDNSSSRRSSLSDSEDYRTEAERLADDGTTATREVFDNVIQNVNDSIDPDAGISFEIYDSVEDFNKGRVDNDKAPSNANAFIDKKTGKIVFFRDKITTLTRLKQVIAHELVGHEGIERLLGGRYYNVFLRSIRKLARRDSRVGKLLEQVQRNYGDFYAPESYQIYEELGAHLAELYARKPETLSDRVHSYIRKLKVMFRNALRNWGVDIEFNQVDLVDIFAKAREAVETNTANESTNNSGRRYSIGSDGQRMTDPEKDNLSDMWKELEGEDSFEEEFEGEDFATLMDQIDQPRSSVQSPSSDARFSLASKLDPSKVTSDDVVDLLERIHTFDNDTYIPVRANTPNILIQKAKEKLGLNIPDLPIIMSVEKAKQAMEEKSSNDNKDKAHGITPYELSLIMEKLDKPDYIFIQKNGRFSELVKIRGGNGKKHLVVIDYENSKNSDLLNGYNGGYFNVVVTAFEPEEDYLKNYLKHRRIIFNKKERASQSDYGSRNMPSFLNDALPTDIVTENSDNGNQGEDTDIDDIPAPRHYSLVSDPQLLNKLESEPTVKVYRAMQLIDGKLYPPMAAKIEGKGVKPTEFDRWYQADENPDIIVWRENSKGEKVAYFKLDKANGKSIYARYAPYWHTSRTPLNDQFKEAWNRHNLVTVECEIPESELTSGYTAQYAEKPVGETEWHEGSVANRLGKVGKPRRVILSRWNKVTRIVPESEVADVITKTLKDTGIGIPENTVTPSLLEELKKRDVIIEPPEKGQKKSNDSMYDRYGKRYDGKPIRFSLSSPVEQTKNLIAVHNLSEQELLDSLKLGGFPMPSIAIVKDSMGHEKYGDISVVFNRDTIDPKKSKYNKVYGGDAYTPTFPKVGYKFNSEKIANINKRIEDILGDELSGVNGLGHSGIDDYNLNSYVQSYGEDLARAYHDNSSLKATFLKEKGIDFDVEYKDSDLNSYFSNDFIIKVLNRLGEGKVRNINLGTEEISDSIIDEIRDMANNEFKNSEDGRKARRILKDYIPYNKSNFGWSKVESIINAANRFLNFGIKKVISNTTKDNINKAVEAHETEYRQWLNNLFDGIIEKKGLRNSKDYYTPNGNPRNFESLYDDFTLNNIVKAMRKEKPKKSIFGSSTSDYSSIDNLKEDSERIKFIEDEEFSKLRSEIQDRFSEIEESLGKNYGASEMLIEAVSKYESKANIERYLARECDKLGIELRSDTVEKLISLRDDIRRLPTGYFEAKPQRAVGLDEVVSVIIPSHSTDRLRNALKEAGIETVEYEIDSDSSDRLKALNNIADNHNIRFSLSSNQKLDLNGEEYSVASIEDSVKSWFYDIFESDMDGLSDTPIDIKNLKVIGSRAKGNYNTDSDLDVVLEYDDPTDSWREDDVFNMLNEVPHELNGVKVDINPIKKEDSGTIEEWLDRNYDYDKNAEDSGRKYSLNQFLDSGKRFVDVQANQEEFDGLSDKQKINKAIKIIKDKFAQKVIGIDNRVFVNSSQAKEYGYPPKEINDKDIINAKMRASTELDNLVDAGTNFRTEEDGKDGHIHPDAKNFEYFDVLFKVGDQFYKGVINIKNNNRGRLFYDITKIENVTKDQTDSTGNIPAFGFLRDISMPDEKSSDKFSIAENSDNRNPAEDDNSDSSNSKRVYSLGSTIEQQRKQFEDYVDGKMGIKLSDDEKDTIKAILETDDDADLDLNDIPTFGERLGNAKESLKTFLGQLITGLIGDTESRADRKKAPYLWQKDHSTENVVETPYEISRRTKIEQGMKTREEEDRLVLKHLDADKNLFTGLIRKWTKPGALQDWMLKKASRILAPFQIMKPVEQLLFTVAENIMWDEAKQQMVIAPYRDTEYDKQTNRPIGYKYDPNEKNGKLALDIYNNKLNDEFKAIIKERSIANNKFREDFVNRVVPFEQAKLYLARFGRKRLEGASKKIVDGNDQQAYSYITKLKGVIDDLDYNNLISQYDQIKSIPDEQLGRNSAFINSIIGELAGNPAITTNGIDAKLNWLTTNKGLYGYAHHLVSIDPETGNGKPFNALGKISHPWIESIAGDRRGRKGDNSEYRSLLRADLERNRKEAEAEAANRWMEATENTYGITLEEAKNLEKLQKQGKGPGMPEGYEHRHKVVANFGKFRGKVIYLPDETFEAYQMIKDNRSLDSMKQFREFIQKMNNLNGRINEAMLWHPGKAMRDLMAGPFHLLEFLRDWSMKHPTEINDAAKAIWHGVKNSVSPEYWQSHSPESMGEYSESVIYQTQEGQSPTFGFIDSLFNYFQRAIPLGRTLEAMYKEINFAGGADIPLKRIFTTVGEELADKRGLTGQERERFIYDLVNDYAFDTGDLPEILGWLRGKKPDSKSQALGMISRATVPFMGYATRMIKQMITDPVTKGAIPLAKRAFGNVDSDSNLRSEISEISRPFFWLMLKALIAAGLGGILPPPTAEEIQDMPGVPPSARTHGRFYVGDSDKGERWMSTKGLGQLETAYIMDDYLKGKSDIIDFSSEFLTIHPVMKYIANLSGLYSEYDRKVPFTTQTGKMLAGLIFPELTTRFTEDVNKLVRAYMQVGTADRRKQTFIQAFIEKLFGIPAGEVQFDKEGHLRLSDPAIETMKMFGINIREIPFDTIEETTRAEASRISNDAKRIKKLEDYRAGKYSPKTEQEFLKQDFGGDFSSVAEAENYYSNLAERERKVVDTATKLHNKGHWTDLEDIAREKKEAAAEKRRLQNEGKPSRRRPSRRKTSTRPLLNDDLGFINNEIRMNISREEEYQEFYDKLMQNNKKHNPRRGVAGQLERLLKELK